MRVVWCVVLATAATISLGGTASAETPGIVVANGVTQPVFGYGDAIRERVFVDSPYDSDVDGKLDIIAVDIMRPAASDRGLKVPVIMDPSPYYSTLGRGNESELKVDADGDGLLDRWPLFYDNYFVPRGYAVVLMDMIGTNKSTGCPTIHEESDNLSPKVVIDWLNARATARDKTGREVVAGWHNGKTGLIGKSYDGTLANGTAASGVQGLTTIVPISAISSYYDYTRSNGVIQRGDNYLASLANTITNPDRRNHCAPVRDRLSANDGDESGDYTPFWHVRDYNRDVGKVRASVFVVHGLNDENVRPDHFSKWWYGLAQNNVPRKLWLSQTGHIDPFDFRRGAWVDEIHKWFDYWLQGVDNGIMREPMVDIERAADVWETANDWPLPGSRPTPLWLSPSGTLSVWPNPPSAPALSFRDDPLQRETTMIGNESAIQPNRLAYLSAPLTTPLHISGTPRINLQASVNDVDTNFGAILVDYGPAERVQRTGDGVVTGTKEDCWGETAVWGGYTEEACYREVFKRVAVTDREVVTKGIVDGLNINDYSRPTPLVRGRQYEVGFPLLPEDYVFPAGHRVGVIIVGSYRDYGSQADQNRATITISPRRSLIELPIVGGQAAAARAGLK
ncbi:X-Pro dipeptidyl-peptidase [Kibdelosporangium banguiense]|uniref:Xaa-Pro dipeptidyl-peptidase n=1 Tax=Kibdelosporangium banguiense TaxID=1365924 RepID=A0ABS4TU40_9PSEU|nr:Xaa-Pro dipeptidyl-peptidase [Kibdelosporangium banguiense]MBP2327912.1 X-Pro dipeptidyl-peptidase [Kibdelosporangium banguiense]